MVMLISPGTKCGMVMKKQLVCTGLLCSGPSEVYTSKYYEVSGIITTHYNLRTPNLWLPQASAKIALHCSIWLQLITSSIAGLHGNSKNTTYSTTMAHKSRAFYACRGNSRCSFQSFQQFQPFLKYVVEKSLISILLCILCTYYQKMC